MTQEGPLDAQPTFWTKLVRVFRVLFSPRREGYDLPIILVICFTILPFLLLYQQNQLISEQGRISDAQRKIMDQQTQLSKLQSLADQSNMYRLLQLDLNGIAEVIGDMSAAIGAYDHAKDESFPLMARVWMNGCPKRFDLVVQAKPLRTPVHPHPCH
jgi:hypothetical protein